MLLHGYKYLIINTQTGQAIGRFNTKRKAKKYIDLFAAKHGAHPYVIEKAL